MTPSKIQIWNSATRTIDDFVTIDPGVVRIYVCGPTVQSGPHIGHLRCALVYDVIIRWLLCEGYEVDFVQNITDIDDKILAKHTLNHSWKQVADDATQDFYFAYRRLGLLPHRAVRVTESIEEIVRNIEKLVKQNRAYASEGSVYLDVGKDPEYGSLTHQSTENMLQKNVDIHVCKRSPLDFALWKTHKGDEPLDACWPSPWGLGRPGWHIECTSIASKNFPGGFDIHGGGLDLRFPHHENELAQARALGLQYAKYWMHAGLVSFGGDKMSKSLGNIIDGLAQVVLEPWALRFLFLKSHYRSTVDLEDYSKSIMEAKVGFSKICSIFQNEVSLSALEQVFASSDFGKWIAPETKAFMRRDFSTPNVLARIFTLVKQYFAALQDAGQIEAIALEVASTLRVFGFGIEDIKAQKAGVEKGNIDAAGSDFENLVNDLVNLRSTAREEHNWQLSDQIRDILIRYKINLQDETTGTKWSRET